ncbi:hypothetical protein IMZ48_19515 [Candidatus Bathyarchaeota archaeon]|nr:hypothetical protein [Candidatus Bathyarchaeota archaeon]
MLSSRAPGFSQSASMLLGGTRDLVPATTEWTAQGVSISSGHLEAFFHRDRVRIPCDILGPFQVPGDVHPRLAEWISGRSGSSPIFWIDGPSIDAEDFENPLTMLATWVVHLAAKSGFPTLSYFCELRRGESIRQGNSWTTQSLVALVSALLRQMVEWLLPRFDAEIDLSEHRFGILEGTVQSWDVGMTLLEDLGRLMPAGITCVIDGLHWVDDETTELYLSEFIGVLRRRGFKILLTTTGRSPCLRDAIPISETLQLETLDVCIEITGVGADIFGT